MDFVEYTADILTRIAKDNSEGEEMDCHWKSVLPEILRIAEDEIFLTIYRWYIDQPMKIDAAQQAQNLLLPDVTKLDDATLYLHCWMREAWLGISDDPAFQSYVDDNLTGVIHPPEPVYWVPASGILLPISEGTTRQLYLVLVECYKQMRFAALCADQLMTNIQTQDKTGARPHMTVLLTDSPEFALQRNKSYQWLHDRTSDIQTEVREDSVQNCLEDILKMPPHIRVQKSGAILKSIRNRARDTFRARTRRNTISLDDEFANSIPDKNADDPIQDIIAAEYLKRLVECQPELEALFSDGRIDNPKQGERRFKILRLLAHSPDLHSSTIAPQLKTSPATICRDRKVIDRNKDRIQEILTG